MSLDYWRARVSTLIRRGLPSTLEPQVRELELLLNTLCTKSRRPPGSGLSKAG